MRLELINRCSEDGRACVFVTGLPWDALSFKDRLFQDAQVV